MLHRSLWTLATIVAFSLPASAGSIFLDFNAGVPGTIQDTNGVGTGFTARLPGTGGSIPANDPQLLVNTASGRLVITSTNSDLNGQGNIGVADFLGVRLSTLGFGAADDFSFSAQIFVASGGSYSQAFDQFGVFVGSSSTKAFRAGGIFTNTRAAFASHTNGTTDSQQVFNTGLAPQLSDVVILTIARTAGIYSVNYNNLTNSARSGNLSINQPSFLNGDPDLYVGVFINNTGNATPKTLRLDSFSADVATVPEPSAFALSGLAFAAFALRRKAALRR